MLSWSAAWANAVPASRTTRRTFSVRRCWAAIGSTGRSDLLDLKRQLILQGVPGTGKTHVARHLARFLTGGREERIRLVQFHPAYSYEEFVEGIKVRSVTVDGRSDVTYPVEEGLLCASRRRPSRRPAEPHVLLIDEINRGNLPRIFGELLYLLEYREQSVCLPCSRRTSACRQPVSAGDHERGGSFGGPDRSGIAAAFLVSGHAARCRRAVRAGCTRTRQPPGPRSPNACCYCSSGSNASSRRPRPAGTDRPQLFHGARSRRSAVAHRLAAPCSATARRTLRGAAGRLTSYEIDKLLDGAPRRSARRRGVGVG